MFNNVTKIALALILNLIVVSFVHAADKNTVDKKTPVAKATTTGFMQEMTEIRVHEGPNRTGKEVYEFRCKGCHGKNTQGAPMPDDKFEWSMRLKNKGLETMLKHSMEGFNNYLMPPKGGCRDCNQEEVYAGVFYMLERSGIKIKKPTKK